MRVLYFSDSYGPHDFRFLAYAAEIGFDVTYLQRRGGRVSESRPLPDGVTPLVPLDPDGDRPRRLGVVLIDELRRVLEDVQPDVVHAGPLQPCAWLMARTGFARLVSMSWGSDLMHEARFGLGRWLAAGALRGSSVFIGDCQAVRQRAVELGADDRRTVVFPWGVDLERFRPGRASQTRERLGWQSARVLLCTRSWEAGYGVETVLEAFLRAARHAPDLRLILAGDGSLRPPLIDRMEASGLAERIWLPGYVPYDELPMLYHSADIYVSASHSDGSSVSLLEAMACGLPAIVSDIPGNREWIEAGRSGLWFKAGDVAGLESLLRETPRMKAELAAYGRRAREIAEARADWRRNAPGILKAYTLALDDEWRRA